MSLINACDCDGMHVAVSSIHIANRDAADDTASAQGIVQIYDFVNDNWDYATTHWLVLDDIIRNAGDGNGEFLRLRFSLNDDASKIALLLGFVTLTLRMEQVTRMIILDNLCFLPFPR